MAAPVNILIIRQNNEMHLTLFRGSPCSTKKPHIPFSRRLLES